MISITKQSSKLFCSIILYMFSNTYLYFVLERIMCIKRFQINLDNEGVVFKSGETISGVVLLELKSKTKIREIWLEFHGFGKTRLKEGKSVHSSMQYYLYEELTLVENEGVNKRLDKGLHSYPFQFQLPHNLPASCKHKLGKIRYYIKGVVLRKWYRKKKTKHPFTVIDYLDLNECCIFGQSVIASGKKALKCFCSASDPIECSVTLEQEGYIPGECIRVKSMIDNKSNRTIKSCALFISKKTSFHAGGFVRKYRQNFPKFTNGKVKRGTCVTWTTELSVPQLPVSSIVSKIIHTEFFVVLFITPAWSAFNFKIKCPVKIGTIALRKPESVSTVLQRACVITDEAQNEGAAALTTLPSYETAIGLTVSSFGSLPSVPQNREIDKYTHDNPVFQN